MEELWKPVPEYEGYYEVSNLGRIRNTRTGRTLKGHPDTKGYPCFWPKINGRRRCLRIHRCVALAFSPNPDNKPEVNHRDGDKKNPTADNLEWVTSRENHLHAHRTGLVPKTSDRPVIQKKDGLTIAEYPSLSEAARRTGVGLSNISMNIGGYSKTAGGYTWEHK